MLADRNFVEESMGTKYMNIARLEFYKLFEDSGPSTPVFFILSPGVDPLKDVEKLGTKCFTVDFLITRYTVIGHKINPYSFAGLKLGFSTEQGTLHNVSLGQGQEEVAERVLRQAATLGHWVILQVDNFTLQWLCNYRDLSLLCTLMRLPHPLGYGNKLNLAQ